MSPDREVMRVAELLVQLETAAATMPIEKYPQLVGELARLQALLSVKLTSPRNGIAPTEESSTADQLLNVSQTATKLGTSKDWLYRHAEELPFTVRIGRQLRFSQRGAERWIKTHQGRCS